jgi:paraquat-inducible protein A
MTVPQTPPQCLADPYAEPTSHAMLRECQDCGLFQTIAPLPDGDVAHCPRCNATLRRTSRNGLNRALACYITALLLLVIAFQLPFLDLRTVGRFYQATLFTGPSQLENHGMWEISILVLITLVAVPVIQLVLVLSVLLGLRGPHPPASLRTAYSWVETLRPWSMIEVFLLGAFVAYTKLQDIAEVQVGPALIALGGVMLAMVAADIALDHEEVWELVEARGLRTKLPDQSHQPLIGCDCCRLVLHARERSRCPRCGSRLLRRKTFSITRSWAFLGAAIALYVPANIFPVMTVIRFGRGEPNTLLSGVIELIQDNMYPLALLVFLASITVPLIKLVALVIMLIMTGEGSARGLRARTRLYRFVDFIGRWSMIDVFMLTILVALVRMGFIATVLPGLGALAFASVVVLTMFAAHSFDPRLMWDAAEAAGHRMETGGFEAAPHARATGAS